MTGSRARDLGNGPDYRFPVRAQQIVTLRFHTDAPLARIKPLTKWDEFVPAQKLPALHKYLPEAKGHPPDGCTGLGCKSGLREAGGGGTLGRVNEPCKKIMNTIIPLISSSVAGPLGVLHLPRFWLKVSLQCRGKLAPGYPGCGKGYDQMVLDALGLKREAVLAFIKTSRPTYPQFETWIAKQPGAKLDKSPLTRSTAPSAATTTTIRRARRFSPPMACRTTPAPSTTLSI